MNTKKSTKINQLISQWQRGVVYTQSYLSRLGYYHDLIKIYKRNGWLESIGTGAYKLPNDRVDVFGGIYALQQQLHRFHQTCRIYWARLLTGQGNWLNIKPILSSLLSNRDLQNRIDCHFERSEKSD